MKQSSTEITLGECGDNQWGLRSVSFSSRSTVLQVKVKGRWSGVMPNLIAEAETPSVAGICVDQLRSGDYASFTPPNRLYHDTLWDELDAAC